MSGALIGIGNHWRHDDGAGLFVAQSAQEALKPEVEVIELDGEPARLIEAWDGRSLVVVVDAMRSADPAGTVSRVEIGSRNIPTPRSGGSHALGVGEAVRLGRALGRMPDHLVVYGVVGEDFSSGRGLTPTVKEACAALARDLAGNFFAGTTGVGADGGGGS